MWPTGCISGSYNPVVKIPVARRANLSFQGSGPPPPRDPHARHVDQDQGNDTWAGTLNAPWKTIDKALRSLQQGQAAYIHKTPLAYTESITTRGAGSATKPIWLIGDYYGNGRAVLTDAGTSANRPLIKVQHPYWIVSGFEVDATGSSGAFTVQVVDTHSVALRGLEASGPTGRRGVQFLGAKDVAIMDSWIHDFVWPGNDSHGILVYYNCERVEIWENRCSGNGGDSVQVQGPADSGSPGPAGAKPPSHVTIAYNSLSGDAENAVDLKSCNTVTVRGNRCSAYRPATGGAGGSPKGDAIVVHANADNVVIELNEISDCGRGLSIGAHNGHVGAVSVRWNLIRDMYKDPAVDGTGAGVRAGPADRVEVYNNTFYNLPWKAPGPETSPSGYAVKLADDGPISVAMVFNNIIMDAGVALYANRQLLPTFATGANLIYRAGNLRGQPFIINGQPTSLKNWQGQGFDCGSYEENPLFVNAPGQDFRTGPTSRARNGAVVVQPPGPWQICGSGPDIGYEESCP